MAQNWPEFILVMPKPARVSVGGCGLLEAWSIEQFVLDLHLYWPIIIGGEMAPLGTRLFEPVAGYHCQNCNATFFEATPELIGTHDCNQELARRAMDDAGMGGAGISRAPLQSSE